MAKATKPSQVKLVVGAIFSSEGILLKARQRLKQRFGQIDFQSPVIPFNYTRYYEDQMGNNLRRQWFSFQRLIEPQALPEIKLYTNRLEMRLSGAGRAVRQVQGRPEQTKCVEGRNRRINLDPGYITAAKLILATCKDYSHRIYLDKGIFAEVTLNFHAGSFLPLSWTYPDYQSPEYLQVFNAVRKLLLQQSCE